jgi:hypothetical protein
MTFQVGLFGRDGMVLASDTKSTEYGTTMDAVSWSTTTSKLQYDEEMNTVIAVAGDRLARTSARDLIEQWDTLSSFERERLAEAPFLQGYPTGCSLSSLLIVRAKERIMLHYTVGQGSASKAHTSGKVISGEASSLAILFLERYADLPSCSMLQLKRLAALTVWLTAQLKSSYVGGLEMVAFPNSGRPEMIKPAELEQLEADAKRLDATVRQLIGKF